ncbi:Sec12-like protein [Thalictrum thalictroides]|uniref:Sec12-like protein n=1 Tax=Thalictrum thalictroides TaxID=46969 RepID=A0A7J6VMQ7_THATH|nr:Sec12-like protein [Thalictrum thalictroides]
MNASLRVQTVIKRAHLGIVTVLMFSEDSRSLVSTSFDSSARVTLIESKKENRMSIWIVLFMVLLAVLAYFLISRGAI